MCSVLPRQQLGQAFEAIQQPMYAKANVERHTKAQENVGILDLPPLVKACSQGAGCLRKLAAPMPARLARSSPGN